ncbi:MAG: hypothetical protein LBC97_16730, partial [Bifidobacteriaceae bacterium]|nr:hypothetical protein [Bifidobacteriaceae bacterium]
TNPPASTIAAWDRRTEECTSEQAATNPAAKSPVAGISRAAGTSLVAATNPAAKSPVAGISRAAATNRAAVISQAAVISPVAVQAAAFVRPARAPELVARAARAPFHSPALVQLT